MMGIMKSLNADKVTVKVYPTCLFQVLPRVLSLLLRPSVQGIAGTEGLNKSFRKAESRQLSLFPLRHPLK